MTLTATQIAHTGVIAFASERRYFAGPLYAALPDFTIFTIGALPTGWNADTADGSTFTNVTTRVTDRGRLNYRKTGNAIVWDVSIEGTDYSETYFGLGRAIACLQQFTVYDAGVASTTWGLAWLGVVDSGEFTTNYKAGDNWTRQLRGPEACLERADTPRLIVGPLNIAADASITPSSVLSTPTIESGKGEFAGAHANVDGENVNDGNLATPWISQDAPVTTEEVLYDMNGIKLTELFMHPVVGYNWAQTWWLEIGNLDDTTTTTDLQSGVYSYYLRTFYPTDTSKDLWLGFRIRTPENVDLTGYGLSGSEFGVVCGDRAWFESYTGGARDAQWILETKSWHNSGTAEENYGASATSLAFQPAQTGGWLQLWKGADTEPLDTVCWNATGAAVTLGASDATRSATVIPKRNTSTSTMGWSGAAVDIGGINTGQSIRRRLNTADSGTDLDWLFDSYPIPGGQADPDVEEYLLVDLGSPDSALKQDVAAGATTIYLTDVTGWPVPTTHYYGIIEEEEFTYTGVDYVASTLTGVTGIAAAHLKDAPVYYSIGGVIQYGWPIIRCAVERKFGVSQIAQMRWYFSQNLEVRKPGEDGWENDYDASFITLTTPTGGDSAKYTEWSSLLSDGTNPYRRIRYWLIIIDAMSDGGRAKVNEIKAELAQLSINGSTVADMDTATSFTFINYLLSLVPDAILDHPKVYDNTTPPHGILGSRQIAVASYTKVLEDIAKSTGCVVRYALAGGINWDHDPWWPANITQTTPELAFTAAYIRGDIQITSQKPTVDAVQIAATDPERTQAWTAVYPAGGDAAGKQVKQIRDIIASTYDEVLKRAEAEYYYEQNRTLLNFTVKGIGDWLRPDMWLTLTWDIDGDGTNEITSWLTQEVVRTWDKDKWECTVQCTGYWHTA